jgi:hypothetical protein
MELKIDPPGTPNGASTIQIGSPAAQRTSPNHRSSMTSMQQSSKRKWCRCETLTNWLASCFTKKPLPLASAAVIGQKMLEKPAVILRAMNPNAEIPRNANPLDINVRNNRGESLVHLICKGENLSKVFSVEEEGLAFTPSQEILDYLVQNQSEDVHLDFEARTKSDEGFLATMSPAMRMYVLNNTRVANVSHSTSCTFRGALEKALLFSSTEWMDPETATAYAATWITDNALNRKAYLIAAKRQITTWPEKYQDQLEYPEVLYPLGAVVKYSCMPEWLELLREMVQELNKPRRNSPGGIHHQITLQLEQLSEWLQQSDLLIEERENYNTAKELLESSSFYQTITKG